MYRSLFDDLVLKEHMVDHEETMLCEEGEHACVTDRQDPVMKVYTTELPVALKQQMNDTNKRDSGPIIAIDMDDVLCQTAGALTQCEVSTIQSPRSQITSWPSLGHNTVYGTSLTVDDTHYFHVGPSRLR